MSYLDPATLVLVIAVTIILVLIQVLLEMRKRPREPKTVTRTLLQCMKCGERIETNYEPGDFIGLIKGKCRKCGGPTKIIGIYTINLEQKQGKP